MTTTTKSDTTPVGSGAGAVHIFVTDSTTRWCERREEVGYEWVLEEQNGTGKDSYDEESGNNSGGDS